MVFFLSFRGCPNSSKRVVRSFTTAVHLSESSSRFLKYSRRAGYLALGAGTIYGVDRVFNASSIARNFRTLWTCAMITLDYKLNFTPEKSDQIPELHERVAERMYHLFTVNGGLYIKIGQALAANAAFLPKPIQVKFSKLFDDAPQVSYPSILSVFQSEFGRPPDGPDGVFEIFEEEAIASASIAQVHKAKLWSAPGDTEEKWVAVKIQKPDVAKQVNWDLGAYQMVMWMFENWAFDLPVYFVVDFVSEHLREELDFELEMQNANRTAAFVASEPRLADAVYIPKVYPELSTKRIMTAEWIEGVRLSDRAGIRRLVRDEDADGLPSPFPPMKGGVKAVMQTMVELFSAQMFSWGWIHCDPHPGNVIIRPHPSKPSVPQLVLLDHGLYVRVKEDFRIQWSGMWKALLISDYDAVKEITTAWGVGLPDLFASATLMRPVRLKRREAEAMRKLEREQAEFLQLSQYEQSVRMKAKLKEFLIDTDRMPKELLFILRNMRIVQGNNQSFGSPVNRIKITGFWASRSLTRSSHLTFTQRLKEYWRYIVFRGVMFSLDAAFWTTRVKQWVWHKLGKFSESFEDELEKNMRAFTKGNLGMDVGAGVFDG